MVIISRMLAKGLLLPEADRNRESRLTYQQEEILFRCKKEFPNHGKATDGGRWNATVNGVTKWNAAWYSVQGQWGMAIFTWGLVLPGSNHCITYLYSGFVGTKGEVAKKKKKLSISCIYLLMCYQKHCCYLSTTLEDCFKNFNLVTRNDFLED